MSIISYTEDALVIRLKTSDPAALHAQLLGSITRSISYCLLTPEKPKGFEQDTVCLLDLLKELLPGEHQLK